jgi:hypothetical protein
LKLLRYRIGSVQRDPDRFHHLKLGLAKPGIRVRFQRTPHAGQASASRLSDSPEEFFSGPKQKFSAVREWVEGRVRDEQNMTQLFENARPSAPTVKASAQARAVAQYLVACDDHLQ